MSDCLIKRHGRSILYQCAVGRERAKERRDARHKRGSEVSMRRIRVLVLAIALASLMLCMTACSLVRVNEERRLNRAISTVAVRLDEACGEGARVLGNDVDYFATLDVTRRELADVSSRTFGYMAQFGQTLEDMDFDESMRAALKSLTKQKYLTLVEMGEMLKRSKETGRFDALYCRTDEYKKKFGAKLTPEGLLTISERYEAIRDLNKALFEESIEKFKDDAEKDAATKEKSETNNKLVSLYAKGYFVSGVAIAKKDESSETGYSDGLYRDVAIDDGDKDTPDLDFNKVFANVKLTKDKDEKTAEHVCVPIDDKDLVLEEKGKNDAKAYIKKKQAKVKYAGHAFAEKTEDNDSGFEVEEFESEPIEYELVAPRTAHSKPEKEDESMSDELRYMPIATWEDEAKWPEGLKDKMAELKSEIFDPRPTSFESPIEKDAYRRLQSSLEKNKTGFSDEIPSKKDGAAWFDYEHYNGLKYYYDTVFAEKVVSAGKRERTSKISEIDESRVEKEYAMLVEKDKLNYDRLTDAEKVDKFFETLKTDGENKRDGIEKAYYVPIEALCAAEFEVKPDDKRYRPMFEFGEDGKAVKSFNDKYVEKKDDGKYFMRYAYENADGTHRINMFYVAHILIKLDDCYEPSDEELADRYAQATKDRDEAEKIEIMKKFMNEAKTCPQLESYLKDYDEEDKEKEYELKDLFRTDEETGEMKYETCAEAVANMDGRLKAKGKDGYRALLDEFIDLSELYSDDGGRTKLSGYPVGAGEVDNGWAEDFTAIASEIYFDMLNKGLDPTELGEGEDFAETGRIRDAYSMYGLHKMMVSFAPFVNAKIDKATGALDIDAKLNLKGDTHRAKIEKGLREKDKAATYSKWTESITDEIVANCVKTDESYLKGFIRETEKSLKK